MRKRILGSDEIIQSNRLYRWNTAYNVYNRVSDYQQPDFTEPLICKPTERQKKIISLNGKILTVHTHRGIIKGLVSADVMSRLPSVTVHTEDGSYAVNMQTVWDEALDALCNEDPQNTLFMGTQIKKVS